MFTFLHRMIEALTDPKTWLFALFAALAHVTNSLVNQRHLIVASFGFTPLQTTLLGCVDGIIEIVAIASGVILASRIPNSRAFVGCVYTLPSIMAVFLINLLPWSNKIGLLFSVWITGVFWLCVIAFCPYAADVRYRRAQFR
jgi:ACS family allantoate permease-like MFS transporter